MIVEVVPTNGGRLMAIVHEDPPRTLLLPRDYDPSADHGRLALELVDPEKAFDSDMQLSYLGELLVVEFQTPKIWHPGYDWGDPEDGFPG